MPRRQPNTNAVNDPTSWRPGGAITIWTPGLGGGGEVGFIVGLYDDGPSTVMIVTWSNTPFDAESAFNEYEVSQLNSTVISRGWNNGRSTG